VAEGLTLPRIKVCGLTDAEAARAAAAAGADAIGLVHFAPSPRSLTADEAARLVAGLPEGVLPVAVLVDATPETALAFAQEAGARAVQLCGTERAADWRGFPLAVLRRVAVAEGAAGELAAWRGVALGFVLDHPAGPGGSGRAVDLELAARLAAQAPCLLAGGLDEHNVSARVHAVRPAGVDASSRLELAPGRKDAERVRAFVAAAHAALVEVEA